MFLHRFLAFVFLLTLICGQQLISGQEIMPLNQIRPGDKGYGLTVFLGSEPEPFDFEVIGIVESGWGPYIMVELSGGPKGKDGLEILNKAKVMSGMSGSPMYTNSGKIIGALSSAPPSQINSKALVTPIESMLGFRPKIINEYVGLTVDAFPIFPRQLNLADSLKDKIKPGDMYTFCLYWGDDQYCPSGTVTHLDPKNQCTFLTLGHPATDAVGPTALPFWRAEVLTEVAKADSSFKVSSKIGPALGSIIFDGPFGQIGKLGALPKFFPMTISIEDYFSEKLETRYSFAYTRNAGAYAAAIIVGRRGWIGNFLDVEAEITIDVVGQDKVSFKGDFNKTGPINLILDSIITEDLNPVIDNINVVLRVRPKYKNLDLQNISVEVKDDDNNKLATNISIVAAGNTRLVTSLNVSLDKKYLNKKLYLADGRELLNMILSSSAIKSGTVNLLNEVSDRDALYLFFADEQLISSTQKPPNTAVFPASSLSGWLADEIKPPSFDGKTAESNNIWMPHPLFGSIEILAKINKPGQDYIINGKKDFTISPADQSGQSGKIAQPQGVAKKKFWLF